MVSHGKDRTIKIHWVGLIFVRGGYNVINKIYLDDVATYEGVEFLPSKVNYLYGGNGTGKTTLSKVISNRLIYPKCTVDYTDEKVDCCIYNQDFVRKQFSQSSSVKGIFTLGEDTKEAQEYIENRRKELDKVRQNISGNKEKIEEFNKLIEKEEYSFAQATWEVKKKYEDSFKVAFEGFMGSMKIFAKKCIVEDGNPTKLEDLDNLIERKNILFDKNPVRYEQLQTIVLDKIIAIEADDVLATPVIGKENLQISNLIGKLQNSDWVKNGRKYLDVSESVCPFCQQPITEEIRDNIEDFFDESYKRQCDILDKYQEEYILCMESLFTDLSVLRKRDIQIIDLSSLDEKVETLRERHKVNLLRLEKKIQSPSNVINLEILTDVFEDINESIRGFKNEIKVNNSLLDNIATEQAKLKCEVWRYIVEELKDAIEEHKKKISGINKGIEGIKKVLVEKNKALVLLDQEIKTKEASLTSTEHTKNEINRILKEFGFTGFIIDDADTKGSYKIVRANGCCVEETLSEGEYTFITFLYFYQMIKGSTSPTGITRNKMIVIDDPISSLDSNILFIVSHLVKDTIQDCNNNRNGIKQVFVLTHNIYFHKEVTFRGSRDHLKLHEKFWIISKMNEKSYIKEYPENPIQTTYELLWRELDSFEEVNQATIFNTLRRILEYYFNIIGGLDYERCIHSFEGEEKLVCKSLVSWINDGSHFVNDDMLVYIDESSIEKYLYVFKKIFDKMGHLNHYNMMMKIDENI